MDSRKQTQLNTNAHPKLTFVLVNTLLEMTNRLVKLSKFEFNSTKSAETTDTWDPDPMATPTSAAARATESLRPSPAKRTNRLPIEPDLEVWEGRD